MAETGYSDGSEKPAGGSISREPNPAHPLAFIVSDTAEENISAVFDGDVASDFADRGLVIDGIFYATNTAVFSGGNTTVTFIASGLEFEDGENYACEFGLTSDYLPSAFISGDWALEDAETGGTLNVIITGAPSKATRLSYRVGSGSWVSRANLDSFQITGLTDGDPYSVILRAESGAGSSAASSAKSATPTGSGGAYFTSDPEITGTRGGMLTGVDATYSGTDTLTRGWYYDGVLQSTSSTFNDTDTSKGVEFRNSLTNAGVSVSTYRAIVTTDPLFVTDFSDETPGQPLADEYMTGTPPFSPVPNGPGVEGYRAYINQAARAETYQVGPDGALIATNNDPYFVGKPTGDNSHYVQYKVAIGPFTGGDVRFSLAAGISTTTALNVSVRFATHWVTPYVYSWILEPGGTNVGLDRPANDGDLIGLMVDKVNGKFYIDLNGEVLNPSGYSFSSATGDAVGMGLGNSQTKVNQPLVYEIKAYSSPQVLVDAVIGEGITTRTSLAINFVNPVPGATDTEYRIDVADGPMIEDWTATGSVGRHTVDVDIADEYEGKDVIVSARNVGGAVKYSRSPTISLPYFPKPFRKGINEGVQEEWGLSAAEKNLARNASFREYDSYSYLNPTQLGAEVDGIIRHWAAGKTPGCRIVLPQAAPVGVYAVTYPSTITAVFENLNGYSVNVAPSGGYAEITATQETGKTCTIKLNGTIPSGGFEPQVLPKVDPYPAKNFHAVTFDNYDGLGVSVIRFMTSFGTNRAISEMLGYIRGAGAGHGNVSLSHCVDICNEVGADLYLAIPHYYTDSVMYDICEYVHANLDPSLKLIVEWSNEVWNGIFISNPYCAFEGCKAGFYSPAGDTPIPGLLHANVNQSTGELLQAYDTGDTIFTNLYGFGFGVWRANKPNSAGMTDKIETTSNAAWTLVANSSEAWRAHQRFYSHQARVLYDQAFAACGGDRDRFELAVCTRTSPNASNFDEILKWNDLALYAKHVMVAPYFGGNLSPYNSTGIPNWAKEDKDLVYTNPSAWRDKFFLAVAPAVGVALTNLQSWYEAMHEWYRVNYPQMRGYVSLGSYECEHHFAPTLEGGAAAWPSVATVDVETNLLMRDPRWGPILEEFYNGLKDLGGLHCIFERVGTLWGQTHYETDTDMIRYVTLASITEG